MTIATVTGTTTPDDLGKTLMHEHICIGFPGYEFHTMKPGPSNADIVAIGIDRIQELQDLGFKSMLDPCPNDLGRDVDIMGEIAVETGFQVICATGLYHEHYGANAYWRIKSNFESPVEEMAELFISELVDGIGDTGIRAGIIKVATGKDSFTKYEQYVLEAAAQASLATGAPITTHTEQGTMGDEQQRILTNLGVPAHQIIIGHSCGSEDHNYHMHIAKAGSYLGFDRFGCNIVFPDEKRIASLIKLLQNGVTDRIVISHDSVWCTRGEIFPPSLYETMPSLFAATHFSNVIAPQLLDAGISQETIDQLLIENPRRFFTGEKLGEL